MISQVVKFSLQTVSTVVLARLLTPNDYGLVAMVTAITGFIALFQDMGLSSATIQRANITHSQVSDLFWLNTAVSLALALILGGCATIISRFYDEPRLTRITLVLAGTFVLSGLAIQHRALLSRQMRFAKMALVDIGSASIGIATGIVMALYGAEYWALVGMSATGSLSSTILVWVFCTWRPNLPVRGAGIVPMLKFGGYITGFDMVNYFARNLDSILLGRFWGANVLGFYSRAYTLMMLPITQVRAPLSAVALPALSHINDDPVRYRRCYIKLITLIAFITMPIMAFLSVCADQVIYLLLGSQWSGAAGVFRILCINAFIQPTMGTAGLVTISLGQSKRYFGIGTIDAMIIAFSFALGLFWGAVGVAVAYTIATYVILVPTLWYCYRQSPLTLAHFFASIVRPLAASAVMCLVILSVQSHLSDVSVAAAIASYLVIGSLTYVIALSVMPGGLVLLKELCSYRSLLTGRST
jgi:PST family polysaccharide transporter